MPDFTLNTFHKLLVTLKDHKYTFQTFAGFLKEPAERAIILRHDVDARKMNSLQTAKLEKELGITGTYYFRIVPGSFDEEVIKQIAGLGHEIGYHYEDLSGCAARGMRPSEIAQVPRTGMISPGRHAAGSKKQHDEHDLHDLHDNFLPEKELADMAIVSFRENLEKLRRVVTVETICMHGSPLSNYDNRMLWEKYDYRDYGIIGEPYFDINFDEVLYLTDTGRRWDGDSVSIRDKASGGRALRNDPVDHFSDGARLQGRATNIEKRNEVWGMGYEESQALQNKYPAPRTPHLAPVFRFHSTYDIINAAESLPDKIMITVHPQRWDNRLLPWIRELIWQNIKNVGKRIVNSSGHPSLG